MDRTFIVGWYGMHNTGDDALFVVSSWGARQWHNAGRLLATAQALPVLPDGLRVQPVQSPQQLFKGQNRLRRYLSAWRSDRILFGGGSVFQTDVDIRDKITMMKLAGPRGHQAVGVGLGPFADGAAERACAEALKRMDFVGLRDAESLDIAESLAADTPKALTFDLAPLLFDAYGIDRATLCRTRQAGSVGIALCPDESLSGRDGGVRAERRRAGDLAAALRRLGRERLRELVLIDFNGHHHFGDARVHRQLVEELGDDLGIPVRHLPYSPDLRDSLRQIASLDAIVAMRLHAAVFAYFVETPTIVLAYHPKCRGWADAIGLDPAQVLDSRGFDPERLGALLHRALDGELGAPALAFAEARGRALQNWRGAA